MTQTTHKTPHMTMLDIIDLCYDKIKQKLGNVIITENGCWEYRGRNDGSKGHTYGRISVYAFGRLWTFRAHRVSYAVYNGEDPAEMLVCHKCDRTLCINPDHLFLGSTKDNALDMVEKGRFADCSGEKNPRSKVTEKDVELIVAKIQAGLNNKQIAEELDITHSSVSLIRRGKSWKKVLSRLGYEPVKPYSSLRKVA